VRFSSRYFCFRNRKRACSLRVDMCAPTASDNPALRWESNWPKVLLPDGRVRTLGPLSLVWLAHQGDLYATGYWVCRAVANCGVRCGSTAASARSAWSTARSSAWTATACYSSAAAAGTAAPAAAAAAATLIRTKIRRRRSRSGACGKVEASFRKRPLHQSARTPIIQNLKRLAL
jgi:hypothetical protein